MPTAEVVRYEPILGRGFMKLLDPPGGRVVFHANLLPQPIRGELEFLFRLLRAENRQGRGGCAESVGLSRQMNSLIVGCRFSFEVRPRPDGLPAIERKSIQLLSRPAPKPPPAAEGVPNPERRVSSRDTGGG